ncbi:MAG: NTP transferase domain-containing protein, partial [Candidatus Nitrosotenuis sp.]
MIALIMAGGKGTRMGMPEEKLLLRYKKPTILHVIEALQNSKCFSKIFAATSPNSPNTEKLISEHIDIIKTSGKDYVSDLNNALSTLNDFVFVVSGDLPLLDHAIIQDMVSKHQKNTQWQSFLVTKKFLDKNNLSLEYSTILNGEECYYTGISIVSPKESNQETCTIYNDTRIAVNLNTK